MKTTTEKLPTPKGSFTMTWLVLVDGRPVGTVQKDKQAPRTVYPYKAFRGIGETCTYAGYSYDAKEAQKSMLKLAPCELGGLAAAVALVAS